MDNSFQTSFIPKKPVTSSTRSIRPVTSPITAIAVFILIIVGVSCAGLYIYKSYLIKQKQTLSASLDKIKQSFEGDTINELELYDKRVTASQKVLDNHIVFSPMFSLLGSLTIPTIQYTKFNEENSMDKSNTFTAKMTGVARDYRSIATQADVFNTAKGRYFKNVVFSNLTKDKNNNVGFDVEFTVDPNLLSYEKNLVLEQAQGLGAVPTTEENTAPQAQIQAEPQTQVQTPPSGAQPQATDGIVLPPINSNQ
jgi:hypothetical protein